MEKDRRNSFHGNQLAPPIGLCLHGDVYWQVNEWDSRHIEEPAYEARQEGYAAARELLSLETGWTVDCVLPILHNAMFTLNTVRNIFLFVFTPCLFICLFAYCRVARCHFVMLPLSLSLLFSHTSRQTVSFHFQHQWNCFRWSSHLLVSGGEKFQFLVMNVVMTAVKKGLRSKHEVWREVLCHAHSLPSPSSLSPAVHQTGIHRNPLFSRQTLPLPSAFHRHGNAPRKRRQGSGFL